MSHTTITVAIGGGIAAAAVLATAVRLHKSATVRQRLAASIVLGLAVATAACMVMYITRRAALAAGHRPIAPQLAGGWLAIFAAVALITFIIATWRAGIRAAKARARERERVTFPPARGRRARATAGR
jgi:small-conductance mechanosensitive channel